MFEVKRRFSQLLRPGRADMLETEAAPTPHIPHIPHMWGSNANDKPLNSIAIRINIERRGECVSDWVLGDPRAERPLQAGGEGAGTAGSAGAGRGVQEFPRFQFHICCRPTPKHQSRCLYCSSKKCSQVKC